MRLACLLVCCAAVLLAATARAQAPLLDERSAAHVVGSGLLAGGGYAVAGLWTPDRRVRFAAGVGFSFALGAAKEALDLVTPGVADWADLGWNALGAVGGGLLALAVDLLVFGPRTSGPSASEPAGTASRVVQDGRLPWLPSAAWAIANR